VDSQAVWAEPPHPLPNILMQIIYTVKQPYKIHIDV